MAEGSVGGPRETTCNELRLGEGSVARGGKTRVGKNRGEALRTNTTYGRGGPERKIQNRFGRIIWVKAKVTSRGGKGWGFTLGDMGRARKKEEMGVP